MVQWNYHPEKQRFISDPNWGDCPFGKQEPVVFSFVRLKNRIQMIRDVLFLLCFSHDQ